MLRLPALLALLVPASVAVGTRSSVGNQGRKLQTASGTLLEEASPMDQIGMSTDSQTHYYWEATENGTRVELLVTAVDVGNDVLDVFINFGSAVNMSAPEETSTWVLSKGIVISTTAMEDSADCSTAECYLYVLSISPCETRAGTYYATVRK